jgi:hypothetical protein
MIDKLKEVHETPMTPLQLVNLRREVIRFRRNGNESVSSVYTRLRRLQAEIRDVNESKAPDDLELMTILMEIFENSELSSAIISVRAIPTISLDMVYSQLRTVEESSARQGEFDEIAAATSGRHGSATPNQKSRTSKKATRNPDITCEHCQRSGHTKDKCWVLYRDSDGREGSKPPKRYGSKEKSATSSSLVAKDDLSLRSSEAEEIPAKDAWILDSGATSHMSPNRQAFLNFKRLDERFITVANGQRIQSPGKGDIRVHFQGRNSAVTITDVLYAPGFKVNLLSVAQLARKGMRTEFHQDGADIIDDKGNLVLIAARRGNVYFLSPPEAGDAILHASDQHIPEFELWHRRYGHIGSDRLLNIAKVVDCGFEHQLDSPQPEPKCECCVKAKQIRVVNRASPMKTTRPLERVYSDFWGKYSTAGTDGSTQMLTFTDDFSRKSWVYPTQKRSSVSHMFRAWKAEVEAETGQSLYAVRMDNAGELRALESHYPRVKFEYTVPYTPEENGVAERLNRTIITAVRAMLIEAKLPHNFWNLAAEAASYIRNRAPVAGIGWKTPEELYSGNKPDVKHMRIWGSKCYVHIPQQLRNKLDPVAWTGIFVGYEPTARHYRVYDPKTSRIHRTRNIEFEENTPGGALIQEVEDPDLMDFEDPSEGEEFRQTSLNLHIPERPGPIGIIRDSAPSRSDGESTDLPPTSVTIEHHVPTSARQNDSHMETPSPSLTPPIADEIAPATPTAPAEIMETHQQPTEAIFGGPSEESIRLDPDLRRSSRRKQPTKRYEAANLAVVVEPTSYEEALKPGPNKIRWEAAIREELDSLLSNGTWETAELPKERNPISCRWIFKVKYTHTGHPERFKARLVARGFSQRYGIDYEETFAPTLRYESLRLLLAIATKYDLEIEQMDVVSAYLSGKVEEELYMEPPEGLLIPPGQVCRLKKGLYGLKQAAAVWNKEFSSTLGRLNCTAITADRSVFHNATTGIIIGLYVDDLVIVGPRKDDIASLKKVLRMVNVVCGFPKRGLAICLQLGYK